MTQPGLFPSKAPRVSADQVAWLVRALTGRGWLSAFFLASASECYSDRQIRAIASAAKDRIISGQKGYCLIEEATVAEVQHFIAWMRSQAKSMEQRAYDTERALHQRHRTEAA